ncbi:hypothetical protein AB9K41_19555 [Cribrihabitans sp. XS_ASV171]
MGSSRPKVEIGWIVEGDPRPELRQIVKGSMDRTQRALSGAMPGFEWIMEAVDRPGEPGRGRLEPVRLLDSAETDRDARGWDFTIVITELELRGRSQPQVLGMTSSIFATALISLSFIASATGDEAGLEHRVHSLAMHLFGRLNGLSPDRSDGFMRAIESPGDLDRMDGFDAADIALLTERMDDVADLRVEELQEARDSTLHFYARSLWENRNALPGAVTRMQPWSFPLRLRRLTTAAGSALAVLVMTAESWEVAANLSFQTIFILSLVSLAGTSAYLLKAQRLLAPRRGPLREQRVVSNAGTVIAVVIGMLVTYFAVFSVAYLMATGLFDDGLLGKWVGPSGAALAEVRGHMAALAASLSLVIGALGASFEPYGYFRHVMQIDAEV